MAYSQFLLALLFVMTIAHLLTLKLCSNRLDHRTAPLFISGWTLLGLALVFPLYGHLAGEGLTVFTAHPWLFMLCLLKGFLLYYLFVISQRLTAVSLSSRHYVTPLAVGIVVILNSFLGEDLTAAQWFSSLGLCALAVVFFARGHLSDMGKDARQSYAMLVGLAAVLAVMDQVLMKNSNWYVVLLVPNLFLFALALVFSRKEKALLSAALLHPAAAAAGAVYMMTELLKFYQMVTINPVTVIMVVQALTKPVILVLSALIWRERTVREQLVWGVLAFIIGLPLFL